MMQGRTAAVCLAAVTSWALCSAAAALRAVPISNVTLLQRGHRGENGPSVMRLNVTHPNDAGCDTEEGCSFVVGMYVGGWQWKGNKTLPGDFKGLHTGKHRFNRAFLGGVATGEITKRMVWRWEGAFWRRMVDVLVQDLEVSRGPPMPMGQLHIDMLASLLQVEGEENWKLLTRQGKSKEELDAEAAEKKRWKKDWEIMRDRRLAREAKRRKEKEARRKAKEEEEATRLADEEASAEVDVSPDGSSAAGAQGEQVAPSPPVKGSAGKKSGKKVKKIKKKKIVRKRKKIKKPDPTPEPEPEPFVPIREYDANGDVIVRDTFSIITLTSSGNWIFDHTAVGQHVRINVAMWQGKDWAEEVPDNSETDVVWSSSIRKLWRG